MIVVYLGLPKMGTTSFANWLEQIGFQTLHVGGLAYLNELSETKKMYDHYYEMVRRSCRKGSVSFPLLPSALISEGLGVRHVECALLSSGYTAFADDPWPHVYTIPRIATHPKIRFLLWMRPRSAWVASFQSFFKQPNDWRSFAYSYCDNVSTPHLESVYDRHLENVLRVFANRSNFHRLPNLSRQSLTRACEFLHLDRCNTSFVNAPPVVSQRLGKISSQASFLKCAESM